jgi:hypothetical protein
MADTFMFGPMALITQECTRPNTDRLRYNRIHRDLGAASVNPVYVKTFYQVPLHAVQHHGGHIPYFEYECGRTDL